MYTKEQIIDWCESSRLNRCYHCINYKPDDEGKCQIQTCGNDYFASTENYLKELAALKDETPITRDYLKSVCNNLKTNDYIELSFGEYDEDDFYFLVKYINDVHEMCTEYDPVMQWKCPVHTVGQLRMFLTILGLEYFVKQLKS